MVWPNLSGAVSLELFGQLHNVVGEEPGDRDAFFAECIRRWLAFTAISLTPVPFTRRARPPDVRILDVSVP